MYGSCAQGVRANFFRCHSRSPPQPGANIFSFSGIRTCVTLHKSSCGGIEFFFCVGLHYATILALIFKYDAERKLEKKKPDGVFQREMRDRRVELKVISRSCFAVFVLRCLFSCRICFWWCQVPKEFRISDQRTTNISGCKKRNTSDKQTLRCSPKTSEGAKSPHQLYDQSLFSYFWVFNAWLNDTNVLIFSPLFPLGNKRAFPQGNKFTFTRAGVSSRMRDAFLMKKQIFYICYDFLVAKTQTLYHLSSLLLSHL